MVRRLSLAAAVVAAATVMAYMGIASLTDVQEFTILPTNLLILSLASVICGVLMAISSDSAAWLIMAASALAFLIFGGIWSYIVWLLLSGGVIPYIEIALSDYVLLYVAQRGSYQLST